jgi:two-component system CheB/CheR fusion protein
MLRNLLSNAFKYTLHGKVLLGCRRRGDKLRIEVQDTGSGIPEGELEAIFEEFHQLDNPARERSRGLGLGLAIVQRLSVLLSHAIDVRSRPGKGSAFTVEVPLGREEPARQPLPGRREKEGEVRHGRRILVIDDDPTLREMLALLLEGEGYETIVAADGKEAREFVARGPPRLDLVIADYNLPSGMNGLQVVAGLWEVLPQKIPVIILTGDISADTLLEIARYGCVQLNKPMQARQLTSLIRKLLSEHRPAAASHAPPPSEARDDSVIFVVDDDRGVRESMRDLLQQNGRAAEAFASGEAFLAASPPGRGGCLLVDAVMPGMSGFDLLQRMKDEGYRMPAIMITGNGDVHMAVLAMQAGAADFIEKPARESELFASIDRALEQTRDSTKRAAWRDEAASALARLTDRQREIMELVLAGHPSKNIAADLKISQRTVENHRAVIMRKTGSKSLPALARLAVAAT